MKTAFLGLWPVIVVPGLLWVLNYSRGTAYSIWLAVPVYHAFCVAIPLLTVRIAGAKKEEISTSQSWVVPVLPVAGGLLGLGLLFPHLVGSWEFPTLWVNWIHGLWPLRPILDSDLVWVGFMVVAAVMHPFIEEFYWRGFLQARTGVLVSALCYWMAHFVALRLYAGWTEAYLVSSCALVPALLFGWLRKRFGTLWPCVVAHLAMDVALLRVILELRP